MPNGKRILEAVTTACILSIIGHSKSSSKIVKWSKSRDVVDAVIIIALDDDNGVERGHEITA